MSRQTKFNTGDKVRCTRQRSDENGDLLSNYYYIEVGKVYTVAPGNDWDGNYNMTLIEVNEEHPEGPYFRIEDFEIAEGYIDPNEAWDRAMGIL